MTASNDAPTSAGRRLPTSVYLIAIVGFWLVADVFAWYFDSDDNKTATVARMNNVLVANAGAAAIIVMFAALATKRHVWNWFLALWIGFVVAQCIWFPSVQPTTSEHGIADAQSASANPSASSAPPMEATDGAQAVAALKANKPQLVAIVDKVARTDGTVDQKTHDRFWSLVPAYFVSTPERRREFIKSAHSDTGMRFQREFWESIRLSVRAHRVVKSPGYEDARRESSENNPDSNIQDAHAESMLQAAAAGVPYTSRQGTGVFTERGAEQVLANLDAIGHRLQKLFDPTWHP